MRKCLTRLGDLVGEAQRGCVLFALYLDEECPQDPEAEYVARRLFERGRDLLMILEEIPALEAHLY